ncbi:uncharacterized protein [Euphorbia lathyris]|uniref:uncharacterized protein n=1 Tax=Euphorbia lathyris TaxID=212925 RepID=UPI003314104F
MTEPSQEFEISGKNNPENVSEESIDFTLLRLDGFTTSCKTCSPNTNTTHYHTPCSSCGCSGASLPSSANNSSSCNKRRSPKFSAPTSNQIPKRSKKLFLEPQETITAAAFPSLNDFSKITLPCSLPAFSAFAADPYNPPLPVKGTAATNLPQSPPESVKIAEITTSLTTPASKGTATLPPRPPFKRCSSDPSPMKSFSRSASNNDLTGDGSRDYQRLKWMKDCTKEMSQWFDDVMPDETVAEEEEDKGTTEDNSTNIIQANLVTDSEEAVYVERSGESLIVHFKCPCSKGFQILLSGTDCYYKLL